MASCREGKAWEFFGGVPLRVVVDNMKTAVVKSDRYEPIFQRTTEQYAEHRGFVIDPAVARHPTGKPIVERGVQYVRESFFRGEQWLDLAHVQREARRWCMEVAGRRIHGTTQKRPLVVFEQVELACLRPVKGPRFDTPQWATPTVHDDHHVKFLKALYSVPTHYVGKQVTVRGDKALVRIYYKNELIKTHPRKPAGGRATDYTDYPPELEAYARRDPERMVRQAKKLGNKRRGVTYHRARRALRRCLPLRLREGRRRRDSNHANRCCRGNSVRTPARAGAPENARARRRVLEHARYWFTTFQIEGDVTEVLASHGSNHLGGDDFDELLVKRLVEEFRAEHGVDLESEHGAAHSRLFWAVEEAKKTLSFEPYAKLREESLVSRKGKTLHLEREISREEYEELIRPLVESTLESISKALGDAGKGPSDIDAVLLVGGSTRTPLVASTLEERLGIQPSQDVHPDLCVALGAGMLASRLAGREVERVLVDVSPYSFGPSYMGLREGAPYTHCYHPIIRRNTPLPVTRTEKYYTPYPNVESVKVEIYQGEDSDALKNILVGEFNVEGLTPMEEEKVQSRPEPRQEPAILVHRYPFSRVF